MTSMILPLRRYADFRGRSTRAEYWLFVLFLFLLFAGTMALDSWLPMGGGTATVVTDGPGSHAYARIWQAGWITRIAMLAILIPKLAVLVRRLHDIGRSGFWLFVSLVPLIGVIMMLVFLLTDGQRGPNRFGADPKAGTPFP